MKTGWISNRLAKIVEKNVPSKISKGGARRPPWLNVSVRHHIRKRDNLAKKAKRSGKEVDRTRYRKARNKATALIETENRKHLNSVINNVRTDPRAFYQFIASKRVDSTSVPTLKSGETIVVADADKAHCLNNYFASTFTVENQDPFQAKSNVSSVMPDILVTEPGVLKLLTSLDPKKSMGPDNLSPVILKEASNKIAGILTFIFNQSLS